MDDLRIPLILAAGAFFLIVVWRVRPAFLSGDQGQRRALLKAANARVEAATTDAERIIALLDAADAAALSAIGSGRATALYLRAFRLDPTSVTSVERAIAALSRKKPRACESLMWRRLGSYPWGGANAAASRAALLGLKSVYERKRRLQLRAQAIENAMAVFDEGRSGAATARTS